MTGKKLLVADDSLTIQKVIRLALSNEGYDIQAVSDGNDAIQQISLFRPDIVLIDVSLPGKSAFEVKRAINEHIDLEAVRFVLMSSAFESVDEGQAAEVNFHGRLTKPFDPAHLREILQQVMNQVTTRSTDPTSLLQRPGSSVDSDLFQFGAPPPLPMDEPQASVLEAAAEAAVEVADVPGFQDDSSIPTYTPAPAPDADIRQLTESTIRMSGLDDFQWSIQEGSLKSEKLDEEPVLPPPVRESARPTLPLTPPPPRIPETLEPMESLEPAAVSGPRLSVSPEEMEALIRKEVQASLEQFARKILPEMAEKVIKQEIHKLLSDQP